MNMTDVWKKMCFILLDWSDLHMTDSLSIAVHGFASHVLISFSIDEVCEHVHKFQRPTYKHEGIYFLILIRTHVFPFVCIDMEDYTVCCLLLTI